MTATTAAQILATDTNITFQDLLDHSSYLNARDEDLFWKTVNEIRGYQY